MNANKRLKARIGSTVLNKKKEAVMELFGQVNQQGTEAVIFFCPSGYDLSKHGKELKNTFPCMLIGCTTSARNFTLLGQ